MNFLTMQDKEKIKQILLDKEKIKQILLDKEKIKQILCYNILTKKKDTPELNLISHQSDVCTICYESDSLDNLFTTNCNHVFHKNCLHRWCDHNNSCPICRKKKPFGIKTDVVEKVNNMTNHITNNYNDDNNNNDDNNYSDNNLIFANIICATFLRWWNNYLAEWSFNIYNNYNDYNYYINKILDIIIIAGLCHLILKI